MPGLYMGASAVAPGGAGKLYLGAEQIWPQIPAGPSFDAFTIHAWDPDSGSDASGIIPDAIGSAPMRPVSGATPVSNWNGEITGSYEIPFVDAADIADFRALSQATITFWYLRRANSGNFSGLAAYGDGSISAGSPGTWELRQNGSNTLQMHLRSSFLNSQNGSLTINNDEWIMLAIRLGANSWHTLANGSNSISNLSWSSQAKTNINRGLMFGTYAPSPESYLDGVGTTGFRGRFGDIRVHNKALSNAEIDAIYAAGRQSY